MCFVAELMPLCFHAFMLKDPNKKDPRNNAGSNSPWPRYLRYALLYFFKHLRTLWFDSKQQTSGINHIDNIFVASNAKCRLN